jgi:hypothetical protein
MQDQRDLRARLEQALSEGQRLREEVRQLKTILAQHSIPLHEVIAMHIYRVFTRNPETK